MTKRRFIEEFIELRRASYRRAVATGQLRRSEAALGMSAAVADARRAWRKLLGELQTTEAKRGAEE